jgi:hypothetical protein
VPAVTRGSLTIRRARAVSCPTCGGVVRRLEVVELPRQQWAEGLRVAGDFGFGGWCWRCLGRGVLAVAATAITPDGDRYCIEELVPCPDCRRGER